MVEKGGGSAESKILVGGSRASKPAVLFESVVGALKAGAEDGVNWENLGNSN